MTLAITFTDAESITLARLYIQIAEGGEDGAHAEQEVVTLLTRLIESAQLRSVEFLTCGLLSL